MIFTEYCTYIKPTYLSMDLTNQIYPCLWFNGQAKTAAEFYCSIFTDSRIVSENPMVVIFEINGQKFMGLNGGPQFTFNESVSFVINCDTQNEIDHYWNAFTLEGEESMCGWCKDKFGVSWQIVPTVLPKLLSDSTKAENVAKAFLQMRKFDIQTLLSL